MNGLEEVLHKILVKVDSSALADSKDYLTRICNEAVDREILSRKADDFYQYLFMPQGLDDKSIIVIWSGGCDSTALLHNLACKFPEKRITAYSVISYTNSRKTDRECRERLKKRFEEDGITNIDYKTVVCQVSPFSQNIGGLAQPCVWLSVLPSVLIGQAQLVCFGYIRGDDIWHYKEPFKKIFDGMKALLGSDAELCFPLEWKDKQDILHYLDEHNLLDLCNWCEHADQLKGGCGECKDCRAVAYYKEHKELSENKMSDIIATSKEPINENLTCS